MERPYLPLSKVTLRLRTYLNDVKLKARYFLALGHWQADLEYHSTPLDGLCCPKSESCDFQYPKNPWTKRLSANVSELTAQPYQTRY